jgi:type IV pilus assembly protein PilM
MSEKPNSIHTLALELNNLTLKGAQLSLRKGKPFLERVFEIKLEAAETSKEPLSIPLDQSPEGEQLRNSLKKDLIVTTLNASEILIRQLEVKLKKKVDIDAVLAFQSEPLLPYPVENAVLDRVKLSDTSEGSLLALYAARKDHLQQHLDRWHAYQIEPEVVSCSPAALMAFANQFALSEKPQFVLHLGLNSTLYSAQASPQGINDLIVAFENDKNANPALAAADLNSLNFSEISKESYPSLAERLDNMRLDVVRTLYALSKHAKGDEISQILLTGEGAAFNNLAAALCQTLHKPLIVPTTDSQFNLSVAELQKFAIPIGAALTALPTYKTQINFRQQELAYPNPWRRYKKILSLYLVACAFLAVAFYFMANAYVKYREDQLRQQYAELLEFMHKPYAALEKEFAAKASGKKVNELKDFVVPSIKSLSEDDLTNRLTFLGNELQSSPYYYPLLPNVPNVSDVLAWLSTHPNVVAKDPKSGILKPLLQIESFNYSLAKRPDQTKKQEKYQVKVEMEFSSPTPKLAREFHDALIAPNTFVDPKGEVKWNTNRGLYRASFFLKDKTAYPSSS